MRISVFGLGYVGCVSAACFAEMGHEVIGVDIDRVKVDAINSGRSPIVEPGMDGLVEKVVAAGRLVATSDSESAVRGSEVSFVCVGTPSHRNGRLDLSQVERVCQQIAKDLNSKASYHLIVIRSTILPGSTEEHLIPLLSSAGKRAAFDFGVAYNPEFLREGSSIADFYDPARTVVGELDGRSGDVVCGLYAWASAPLFRTDIRTAEIVKYADNSFHALKICFANEMGNICRSEGVDSHRVMSIFAADTRLNLSSAYLKPGAAFGGSCLPKDIRALLYRAKARDLRLPLLESILPSNEVQKRLAVDLVLETKSKNVGVLGLSFKAGTDDLRESPTVQLVETLVGKGFSVRIYDRNVSLARIFGSNKEYLEKQLPHVSSLLCPTMKEVLDASEVIVLANYEKEFSEVPGLLKDGQILIDLVRISDDVANTRGKSVGICW